MGQNNLDTFTGTRRELACVYSRGTYSYNIDFICRYDPGTGELRGPTITHAARPTE